jgi:hypothetical protein
VTSHRLYAERGHIDEVFQAIMSLAFSHVLYDKDALAASNV